MDLFDLDEGEKFEWQGRRFIFIRYDGNSNALVLEEGTKDYQNFDPYATIKECADNDLATKSKNQQLVINALRSGKYKQTRGALRRTELDGTKSYCCLGVVCEIYQQETGKGEWISRDNATDEDSFIGERAILPPVVRIWLGVSAACLNDGNNPRLLVNNISHSAARLNDEGYTFEEIADAMERTWNLDTKPT